MGLVGQNGLQLTTVNSTAMQRMHAVSPATDRMVGDDLAIPTLTLAC